MRKGTLSQITKPVAVAILLSFFIMTFVANSKIVLADTSTNDKTTDLPIDTSNINVLKALGFSTEQLTRTEPSGNQIDKNMNPLGAYNILTSTTSQLAISGVGDTFAELYDIYNHTVSPTKAGVLDYTTPLLGTDKIKGSVQDSSGDLRKAEKAMVAADMNGSGKDSLIIVSIPQDSKDKVKLQLTVSNYNDGNPMEKVYTLVSSLSKPLDLGKFEYAIEAAAGDFDHDGKDEIGIVVARTLFICEADMNKASVISSTTFDETSDIARVSNVSGDIPAMDVTAGDADNDGFEELLVTTGSSNGGKTYVPHLLVYDGTDAKKPCTNIELKLGGNSNVFRSPSIAVGDAFLEGENGILIGGRTTTGKVSMTYVKYNAIEDSYDSSLCNQIYEFDVNDFKAIKSDLIGLEFVSLKASSEDNAMHIVFGGYIYQCMTKAQTFVKKNVKSVYDTSRKKVISESDSHGNITNTKIKNQTTFIMDTVVGNFDGNASGKEQILLLHYNQDATYKNAIYQVGGNEYAYITLCSEDSTGKIISYMDQIWNKEDKENYNYPAICALNVLEQGIRIEYEQGKFIYSDPTVVSILGASPYYNELINDGYKTTRNSAVMKSENDGLIVNADISFGYSDDSAVYGVKVEGKDFEEFIKDKFTKTWESTLKGSTLEYQISANNASDSVVIAAIPYDVYIYNVYKSGVKSQININIPYTPIIKIISLKDYNEIVQANQDVLQNTPIIGNEVLKHTVGDPRSYSSSVDSLSNTTEKYSIVGSESKHISLSSNKGITSEYPLNITFGSLKNKVNIGMKGGSAASSNVNVHFNEKTSIYGSVAQVPAANTDYTFQWRLAAYQYDLDCGGFVQRCNVITYLVSDPTSLPPMAVQGLTATSVTSSVTLKWNKVDTAVGYLITRSETEDSGYKLVGTLNRKDQTQYSDSGLIEGKMYYYKVASYSLYKEKQIQSIPSDALIVQTSTVKSIVIKTQPKLNYYLLEKLDLSDLTVLLYKDGGVTQEVKYEDFSKNNLTISIDKEQLLTSDHDGKTITITHTPTGITVYTNTLKVNADNSSKFTISTGTPSETKLLPNTLFTVNASVKNNTATSLEVILVIALYDSLGNISDIIYLPETMGVGQEQNIQGSIKLPKNTTDFKIKIFIWDGSDLTSSTKTLLSNVLQIS